MSERKVLNKYFPPNFDPSLIKRRKLGKDRQQVVRLMAPFSMRCNTCGEYIYKGKKFNARKETVQGEDYYGIKIFRFYIKCTQCSAEITFKTDPKNTDYQAEHGAQRNFEPWRDTGDSSKDGQDGPERDRIDELLEQEEQEDAMSKLESKAIDSKREMDILDALQEIKARNSRLDKAGKRDVDAEKILTRVTAGYDGLSSATDGNVGKSKLDEIERKRKQEEAEDEEEVRRVFGRAYVEGVPDIELDEDDSTTSTTASEASEPGTPRDGQDVELVASGSSSSSTAAATAVKRKLDAVEPTPASLLSEASRSIVAKSTTMMPPPAKKKKGGANAALAAKLGIKLKK
ncbi:Pre-mRNA-splicing factor cwf16 [Microbotryomycetes sp. JL221]|nr:Pre-mRNA-splicing factor cwf16 [Microbotryomycetes sp. JL221]